ncbi:hypothetical protein FBU30_001106 [Linnemannia zychae]|nr:hypothetical protein FBU30_001106 [Linnemannia zychae]
MYFCYFNLSNVSNGQFNLILSECKGLEVLRMISHPLKDIGHVDLQELIDVSPWSCTQLRHLEINISGSIFHRQDYFDADSQIYLESFYRQLGSLTELVYLDINALSIKPTGIYSTRTLPLRRDFFPGMLTLNDKEGGMDPHGYLNLLEGLKKLKVLKGTFLVKTVEKVLKLTVGWPEARWMTTQWPNLEVAEIFEDDDTLTEPFEWMMKQCFVALIEFA